MLIYYSVWSDKVHRTLLLVQVARLWWSDLQWISRFGLRGARE